MSKSQLNLLIDPPYRRKLSARWLRNVIAETLESQGFSGDIEAGVLVTGDDVVADLNQRYRGIRGTTDVLSFSMNGEDAEGNGFVNPPDGAYNLGEVIISYPQAARQASEHGHETREEVAFLAVHGVLHLMGYDHEEEAEAEAMREQEALALARLGIDRSALFRS